VLEAASSLFGLPVSSILALVVVAFVAGFIDSIAGGGGLLTVPATLIAGLPQVDALATNKLQSSFGSGSATLAFARAGRIDFAAAWPWVGFTFAGSVLGASAVTLVPTEALRIGLPLLLIGVAMYFLFSPALTDQDGHQRLTPLGFGLLIGVGIGFYDGVFGPGTGSFFMLGFVLLMGYGVLRATAHTKLLNFTSNLAALCVFALGGHINWPLGLAMGVGQFLGAQLGARTAMRNGARIIRPMLVVVSLAMAGKLIFDALHG
jgi:uncharacterized protein